MAATRQAVALVLALATLATLSGCQSEDTGTPSSSVTRLYTHYVALGDSYSAGPLIADTETTTGCLRSDHNYPSLLARRLEVPSFTDATCSAADTTNLTHAQHTIGDVSVPPQLDAVTANTDLVTIGMGGNDFGLFADQLRGERFDIALIPRIRHRVARGLRAIRRKAPDADVFLVGYPRLVDPGSCRGRVPVRAGTLAGARVVQVHLNDALRRAARATDTTYVDMFRASRGHGICSTHPWINGPRPLPGRAAPFHPFAVEMRAVAHRIVQLLVDR